MKKQRVHSCNVLELGPDGRRLWHFAAEKDDVVLESNQVIAPPAPLPAGKVAKNWTELWQPKVNVALIPPEHVFLRVVQLPLVEWAELLPMVEFQLEKISPLPVAQVVWGVEVLPSRVPNEQSAIVCIIARSVVEEFLGKLEADNFQPDQLEVPQLTQVLAGGIKEDGAWIYPGQGADRNLCLITWWNGGVLQNVQLLRLPSENPGEVLHEQLTQTSWAGELEGWLTLPVRFHLVADAEQAALWQPLVQQWSEQPVQSLAPLSPEELAKFAAGRAIRGGHVSNLIPAEFAARYHQQFIDRLWMRGLGALVTLYCVGFLVYYVALQVFGVRQGRVDKEVKALSQNYTNVLQLKERVQVLQDQVNLKYAALDCWKAASELLPEGFTLTWLFFVKGSTLELHGTAPPEQEGKITDYNAALREVSRNGQPLFSNVTPPRTTSRPGSQTLTWNFSAELNRSEIQ